MTEPRGNLRIEWTNGTRPAPRAQTAPDLICLSHLRWRFVFQRPQHLMTRAARDRRVFFVEEPVDTPGDPRLVVECDDASGVWVVVPHLPAALRPHDVARVQRDLLAQLLLEARSSEYIFWYWTPMALTFTRVFAPGAVVFDCMDELSAFAFAPDALLELERELLARADLVFTGGRSLFEAKRDRHPSVHMFPSSVDVAHFARARGLLDDPADQRHVARPRLGFFGVIDERMDFELLAGVADARPAWQLVLVGPTAKIEPRHLPARPNLHMVGQRSYHELPAYLSGWDVAMLPFARNAATRFISPTKTPEYLAAGRPVVSTSIRDVVTPYGDRGLVRIADTVPRFVAAVEAALTQPREPWLREVDAFLAHQSWDATWQRMRESIDSLVAQRRAATALRQHGARPSAPATSAERATPATGPSPISARTQA